MREILIIYIFLCIDIYSIYKQSIILYNHHENGFFYAFPFPLDPAINLIAYYLSWCDILCRSNIYKVGIAYSTRYL